MAHIHLASQLKHRKILTSALLLALASLGTGTAAAASGPVVCSFDTAIVSNFNGTPIAAGDTVWFNSVMKLSNVPSTTQAVNIYVINATVAFQDANGNTHNVRVPNARVTFNPNATFATTSYNWGSNMWVTDTPYGTSGNTFLAAVALPVTNGLPGGIKPVSWSAEIGSDTTGVNISWQWAASAYTSFSTNYAGLNVKPSDDPNATIYANSDHAGTPEAYKPYVIGGARGGGGSNWTGSYSGTMSQICDTPPSGGNWGGGGTPY